jgi:Fe-S-cluster-containing hydrogenase component 2
MAKRIFVFPGICNGCRNCQMWCSLRQKEQDEFNASYSRIKIFRDVEETFDQPVVDCTGERCALNEKGEPICVEMCPTGALVYTDSEDAYQKRLELYDKRRVQPLFKLIAPWKYPYPWKEWLGKEV